MYCNSCGSLNKDGQSFCAACGAPLSYQASQPVVPVQPQMYVQPQPVPIQTAVPARPKKSKWAAITGFVLGIITLDLSLLIVFYFNLRNIINLVFQTGKHFSVSGYFKIISLLLIITEYTTSQNRYCNQSQTYQTFA